MKKQKTFKPLKINGYKKIMSGELIEKTPLKTFDNTLIYFCVYQYENKKYYLYDTGLDVIGYTQDEVHTKILNMKVHLLPYRTFYILCVRK